MDKSANSNSRGGWAAQNIDERLTIHLIFPNIAFTAVLTSRHLFKQQALHHWQPSCQLLDDE